MSKKVISFRLSEREVSSLDKACERFGMNRSQVVCEAIEVLLRDYVHEDGALIKRTPWLLTPLKEEPNDEG